MQKESSLVKNLPTHGLSVSFVCLFLQIGTVDSEVIFSKIIEIVEFICERICFKNDLWIRSFGRLTWPRISELIIINILSKVS